MYKKFSVFFLVCIVILSAFGFAEAYYDSSTGRFITQDPYLGEPTNPPSVHRYTYGNSNPTVFIDRHGYESIKVEDNEVYWNIEKNWPGPYNPVTRRVHIGRKKDGAVYLTQEFGGGMVAHEALKWAASKYWDRYDVDENKSPLNPSDISSLSKFPRYQNQKIRDYIDRLDPHQIGGIYADRPRFRSKLTNTLDNLQTAGDVAGAAPGVGIFADVPNTALYGLRGKWTDFGFGLGSIIPLFGQGAIGAKYGERAGGLIDEGIEFVPDRSNQFLSFYHGTSTQYANKLREKGIDLTKGRFDADFGEGFYMSETYNVAKESAQRLYGDAVEVIEFKILKSDMSKLSMLSFDAPGASWADFVRFHKAYSPKELMHGGMIYDIVSGPMVRRITSSGEALAWPGKTQISIHTEEAVELFNKGVR